MLARNRLLCVLAASAPLSPAAAAQNPIYAVQERADSLAGLADVDLDGTPDFIIGNANGPGPGYARVYSGATSLVLLTVDGDSGGDQLGYSVCGAGDVDGDGHADFAVGANAADTGSLNAGLVRIYSGADGHQLRQYLGTGSFANCGTSIALAGDVDGDGHPDLVVGAPYENHGGVRGSARVYSGADGSVLYSLYGSALDDVFGCSVAGAGDLNSDGHADFVVGANQSTNSTHPGYVRVFSGASGGILYTFVGDVAGDRFGSRVAGGGDVNGDGVADILASAPQAGQPLHYGMVRALSGANGSILHTFRSLGAFGYSLAMLGDVNFDGADDYVAGEPFTQGGRVVVVSGRTGLGIYRIGPYGPSDFLGWAVGRMSDITHDGVPEVIISAPAGTLFGFPAGYVQLNTGINRPPSTYCEAKVNSLGCTPAIGFYGVPNCASDDNFRIQAREVLNNAPGRVIFGSAADDQHAFGGTVCIQGSLLRSPIQWSGGSANGDDCSGSFDLPLSQSYMQAHGWLPGTVVYAQWWSRDRGFAAPDNISLTEGLVFKICP